MIMDYEKTLYILFFAVVVVAKQITPIYLWLLCHPHVHVAIKESEQMRNSD